MCGIIAIVRQRSQRSVPTRSELLGAVAPAVEALEGVDLQDAAAPIDALRRAAESIEQVDRLLRGSPGVTALLDDPTLEPTIHAHGASMLGRIDEIDARLDQGDGAWDPATTEAINAALIRVRDALWAVDHDRLGAARGVAALAGPQPDRAAIEGFLAVHQALAGIDRLEVRGRDSAGLHLLVRGHGVAPDLVADLADGRGADPLFSSGAVRVCGDDTIGFVYKAAAEIGELGDNTAALRAAIAGDALLHPALRGAAEVTVLGHTRWASVGIISEPNAHPLNSDEVDGADGPYVLAALNGDIDNFADLKSDDGLVLAPEITTDAKVIPTLVSRALRGGVDPVEAFRSAVNRFEGSVAIGACTADQPDRLQLALHGSGQALYVGLAEDLFIAASEPYGIIEEAARYVRLDGDTPADLDNPVASRGQLLELRAGGAGTLAGLTRRSYDGAELPVVRGRGAHRGDHHPGHRPEHRAALPAQGDLRGAHLVPQDAARQARPARRPLAGRARARTRCPTGSGSGCATARSGGSPASGRGPPRSPRQSFARALSEAVDGLDVQVDSVLATELSGFGMRADMSDLLVVAISQSGTTTDTNRTVDLVRSRGAAVVSIVNRRGSDLTDRSDGVLYTSDGRDVEMSVASTKAFYSQIAAGFILAYAIADELLARPDAAALEVAGDAGRAERSDVLAALRELPDAMVETISRRPAIAAAAQQLAPSKRYWAIVGSGADRIAAEEIRVKLSELCYKAIACDSIEDKKHIDLSSEPLILVCATGLVGLQRRRRGQGGGDLPGAQGLADRHRHRGRGALQRRAAGVDGAGHPPQAELRARHGRRAPLRLRGGAGHRRPGPSAARGARRARRPAPRAGRRRRPARPPAGAVRAGRPALGRRPAQRRLRRPPRSQHRVAHQHAAALRERRPAPRRVPDRLRPPGHAARADRGPDRRARERHRGADPAGRRHQAPGQDGHGGHLAFRRGGAPGAAGGGGAQRRARRATGSATARCARSPAWIRRWPTTTGFTRYRIEGRVDDGEASIVVVDRGGISLDLPLRTESNPLLAAPSTGWPSSVR